MKNHSLEKLVYLFSVKMRRWDVVCILAQLNIPVIIRSLELANGYVYTQIEWHLKT